MAILTEALRELGKQHQLQVTKFFKPEKSKVDQDFYKRHMVNPDVGILDHKEELISSYMKDGNFEGKIPPRDFFFGNAVTMNHQRAERIKDTRDTIFRILSQAAGHGVFQFNLNITALTNSILLKKPVQTGVLFGDVYIDDREFLTRKVNFQTVKENADFYKMLAEKAEEAKKLRRQHINYYFDWNTLVKFTSEKFVSNKIVAPADQKLINSINNAMEDRLETLQQELATMKLDSMSLLAIQHVTKDGRQLFNVPLVERVSRRIVVAVHQLFEDTKGDAVMQRKIAERIHRDFRFDGENSDLNEYMKKWNKYFTKIASGYVPTSAHFSETCSLISASLKETVEWNFAKERELRCGLTKNLTVSLVEQTADDNDDDDDFLVPDGPYIKLFFKFIDHYYSSVLPPLEIMSSTIFKFVEKKPISRLSTWICSTTPSTDNLEHIRQKTDESIKQMMTLHEAVVNRVETLYKYSMDQFISTKDCIVKCGNLLIDKALTIQEATNKHMAIIVDYLANGYDSCLECGKQITSTMLTIFQKCFIDIPVLIVNTFHDGLCSVAGALVDALEQIMIHLPLDFAIAAYHELPQEFQWVMREFGCLLVGYPYVFVAISYVVLYAICS